MSPLPHIVVLWAALFPSGQHLASDRTWGGIVTSKNMKGLGKAGSDFINYNVLLRFPALVYFSVFHSMFTHEGPLPDTAGMFQASLILKKNYSWRCNLHIIACTHFKHTYSPINFDECVHSYNHHNQDVEHSHHLKKFLLFPSSQSPPLTPTLHHH